MKEYEKDRWRIISTKVGNGFSPVACKEKAAELEQEQEGGAVEIGEEEESIEQPAIEQTGSAASEGPSQHLYL
jgi:hypothetical protein